MKIILAPPRSIGGPMKKAGGHAWNMHGVDSRR